MSAISFNVTVFFSLYCDIYLSQTATNKCRAGLSFVHWELIGWLWFAIAMMSCE